jgi:hypothetical protein
MVMWVIAVVDVAPYQCFPAIVASMTGAAINLASRRYEQRAHEGIGYEDRTEDMLAVELGSDETSPESELPAGPAWDEQQAMIPMASADAVASEP